jgi:putative phosphoesterase
MRILILSDIHGNLPAFEAVLAAEPCFGAVVFCGDVVDYGPQPVECVRWLKDHADYLVRGNHDNALALDVDCQCLGTFRDYSVATRAWHRTLLGQAEREFLQQLPTVTCFTLDGRDFHMAHASPQGGLFTYLSMDQWREHITGIDSDYILLGHTHVQGMQTYGPVTVVNPGSVGLARDCPGEACYAVYEQGAVSLRRCSYDVAQTVAALRAAPLPPQVVDGLARVLGSA